MWGRVRSADKGSRIPYRVIGVGQLQSDRGDGRVINVSLWVNYVASDSGEIKGSEVEKLRDRLYGKIDGMG